MRLLLSWFILFFLTAATLSAAQQTPLRVAVIGGMMMSGMWQKVAEAFEERYHIPVEVVVSGPKHELDAYCRSAAVDLVTMHASDVMVDLAADGVVEQLTPWVRNAQMIVGHLDNPARIDANDTLKQALKKIERSGAAFLIHASGGTFEVYSAMRSRYGFNPDAQQVHFTTKKRAFLYDVAKLKGYTLYGVIPFLMKKQFHPDMRGFVFDDPALRRPYLAAIGTKEHIGQTRYEHARLLLAFLGSRQIQELIRSYRISGFENCPVFFPVKQ
jgi:tungstate transport system substrate-binding protein